MIKLLREARIPLWVLAVWTVIGFCWGLNFQHWLTSPPTPFGVNIPVVEESGELPDWIATIMPTVDIQLSFVPSDQITAYSSSALAYTEPNYHSPLRPCRVYMPADRTIIIKTPNWPYALVTDHMGDVLAHEILHCVKGRWHK